MINIAKIQTASGWKSFSVGSALLVMSAAAALGVTSLAQAQEATQASASAPSNATPHHHRFGSRNGADSGPGMMPMSGRGLDRMLGEVKATDAQRTQIKALAQAAQADLKPLHETGRDLHQKLLALFAQPQVDAAAVETLRQQCVANHDAVSKRMLQVALDASQVLTPEQRAQFVAKMQKRHEGMKARRAGQGWAQH